MRTVAGVCMGMSAMGISPPGNQKSYDKEEGGTAKLAGRNTSGPFSKKKPVTQ